jgi:hypothetical protein
LDFNDPPIAIGGIQDACSCFLGWILTIPRLPSGGFKMLALVF